MPNSGRYHPNPCFAQDDLIPEPFFVMQDAARNLKNGGRIVNVSSAIADLRPPFATLYAGAKSALEAFSDGLAQELAPRGITVNVIARAGRGRDQDAAGLAG